jgi:hypothetical protein
MDYLHLSMEYLMAVIISTMHFCLLLRLLQVSGPQFVCRFEREEKRCLLITLMCWVYQNKKKTEKRTEGFMTSTFSVEK